MDYREQLQWINSLTPKQLTEFLHQAFNARNDSDGMSDTRFFLGHAYRFKLDGHAEPWSMQMACVHDPKEYRDGWQDDASLCQYGFCSKCEVETVSYAKQGLCAICGERIYGT